MKAFVGLVGFLCLHTTVHGDGFNCYPKGGDQLTSYDEAAYHIHRACYGYDGKTGAFQGYYPAHNDKTVCVQLNNGGDGIHHKLDMQIRNDGNNGYGLNPADCEKRLSDILTIVGCQGFYDRATWGGEWTGYGWFYR